MNVYAANAMSMLTIISIALGLSMDALAVSVASGFTMKQMKINHALRIALFFGLFQAVMPAIGWRAGLSLREVISSFDHWVAFGLLGLIGCKMIYEALKLESGINPFNPMHTHILLTLSVATSIDALAVGLSFALLGILIVTPALVIGTTTFLLSFLGVIIGKRFGHFFEGKIEIGGGLILIAIGTKILIEHLAQ